MASSEWAAEYMSSEVQRAEGREGWIERKIERKYDLIKKVI